MTIAGAVRVLGLHRATVHRRLQAGVMHGERIHAKLWLIPRAELERWRDKGRLPTSPPRTDQPKAKGEQQQGSRPRRAQRPTR